MIKLKLFLLNFRITKFKNKLNMNFFPPIKKREKKPKKISIQCEGSIFFLDPNEIILFKATNNYTEIFLTKKRKLVICKTLKFFEKTIINDSFFRIHKSYLINLFHVTQYIKNKEGIIIMSNNEEVFISRAKKKLFIDLMIRNESMNFLA